jgi:hypothetical protein
LQRAVEKGKSGFKWAIANKIKAAILTLLLGGGTEEATLGAIRSLLPGKATPSAEKKVDSSPFDVALRKISDAFADNEVKKIELHGLVKSVQDAAKNGRNAPLKALKGALLPPILGGSITEKDDGTVTPKQGASEGLRARVVIWNAVLQASK